MSELKVISRHAGTILVGQLAVMAFGVADTLIAGRYSDAALAALSVGSALYISVYVGLMGVVQALLPIWAEMLGARRQEAVGRSLQQSLYLCAFISIAGMAALLFPGALLRWAQVPELMRDEVQRYLAVLAFALTPSLLFRIYSTFNQSLGKPRLVTWLQIAALAIKIPLSIWLVAGGGGVEAMGAVGCAWATLAVNYVLLILAVAMLRTQDIYRPYCIWRRMERPDWLQLRNFARQRRHESQRKVPKMSSSTAMSDAAAEVAHPPAERFKSTVQAITNPIKAMPATRPVSLNSSPWRAVTHHSMPARATRTIAAKIIRPGRETRSRCMAYMALKR
jgi:MATE family multidrug resistance protein